MSSSLRGKLDELGGFQVAADPESPDQARAAIASLKAGKAPTDLPAPLSF